MNGAVPVACLVHSGGKSLHAIVRVDAENYEEYRKRVESLYDFLEKNGVAIDKQNRNPSRLSRLPGATRNGNRQYLVATNIGRKSWVDWMDFVEGVSDELPDLVMLSDIEKDPPQPPEELITGVLRRGHKMLISGSSRRFCFCDVYAARKAAEKRQPALFIFRSASAGAQISGRIKKNRCQGFDPARRSGNDRQHCAGRFSRSALSGDLCRRRHSGKRSVSPIGRKLQSKVSLQIHSAGSGSPAGVATERRIWVAGIYFARMIQGANG